MLINGAVKGPARFCSYSFRAAAREALSDSMDLAVIKDAFVSVHSILVRFQYQGGFQADEA